MFRETVSTPSGPGQQDHGGPRFKRRYHMQSRAFIKSEAFLREPHQVDPDASGSPLGASGGARKFLQDIHVAS